MANMTSPSGFNTSRNTFVLNSSNNSFSSIRIEEKKVTDDIYQEIMCAKIPEILQNFVLIDKIGEGTFSKVYKARLRRSPAYLNTSAASSSSGFVDCHGSGGSSGGLGHSPQDSSGSQPSASCSQEETFALKYLIPIVKPSRIAKELRFLRDLQGEANIIPIRACFFNSGHTVFVMPIVEHDKFLDYFQKMDVEEVRSYMRNLLLALDRVHTNGIIHRDIKPANFLYNRAARTYALVDFGLSQTQKELDCHMDYLRNEMAKQQLLSGRGGSSATARSKTPSQSKVRANLSHRFTNTGALVMNPSTPPPGPKKGEVSPTKAQQSGLATINTSMASTISLVKAKRALEVDETENRTPPPVEAARSAQVPANKRQRVSPTPYIEMVVEPVAFCGTPAKGASPLESIFVPETPVKSNMLMRTPLGTHDANKFYASNHQTVAPPLFNFNAQFQTPTKNSAENSTPVRSSRANRTPTKANNDENVKYIPETPPKTVQKSLVFASATKTAAQVRRNFSTSTPAQSATNSSTMTGTLNSSVHSFSTPKTVSFKAAKRLATQKPLQPELSNLNRASTSSGSVTAASGEGTGRPGCACVDTHYICNACLTKPELVVPRAGTPGFRAPEILLRSSTQSSKIDMWSTGIIFASLLTGRYPFFRCMEDMICLAEITTILGTSKMVRAARALGKTLVISSKKPPMNLRALCTKLRESLELGAPETVYQGFEPPEEAYDLLGKLLDPNPFTRISASDALAHPFFADPLDACAL